MKLCIEFVQHVKTVGSERQANGVRVQNHAIPANIPTVKPSKHPLSLFIPPPSRFSTVPSPFPFFVAAAALVATGATVEECWVTVIELVGIARRMVSWVIPVVGTALMAWLMMEGARGDLESWQLDTMAERAWPGELESQDLAIQAMKGLSLFEVGREEQMPKLDTWMRLLSLEISRRNFLLFGGGGRNVQVRSVTEHAGRVVLVQSCQQGGAV